MPREHRKRDSALRPKTHKAHREPQTQGHRPLALSPPPSPLLRPRPAFGSAAPPRSRPSPRPVVPPSPLVPLLLLLRPRPRFSLPSLLPPAFVSLRLWWVSLFRLCLPAGLAFSFLRPSSFCSCSALPPLSCAPPSACPVLFPLLLPPVLPFVLRSSSPAVSRFPLPAVAAVLPLRALRPAVRCFRPPALLPAGLFSSFCRPMSFLRRSAWARSRFFCGLFWVFSCSRPSPACLPWRPLCSCPSVRRLLLSSLPVSVSPSFALPTRVSLVVFPPPPVPTARPVPFFSFLPLAFFSSCPLRLLLSLFLSVSLFHPSLLLVCLLAARPGLPPLRRGSSSVSLSPLLARLPTPRRPVWRFPLARPLPALPAPGLSRSPLRPPRPSSPSPAPVLAGRPPFRRCGLSAFSCSVPGLLSPCSLFALSSPPRRGRPRALSPPRCFPVYPPLFPAPSPFSLPPLSPFVVLPFLSAVGLGLPLPRWRLLFGAPRALGRSALPVLVPCLPSPVLAFVFFLLALIFLLAPSSCPASWPLSSARRLGPPACPLLRPCAALSPFALPLSLLPPGVRASSSLVPLPLPRCP